MDDIRLACKVDCRGDPLEKDANAPNLIRIIQLVLEKVPTSEHPNIKVEDGNGNLHKYESMDQLRSMYLETGAVGIVYIGKKNE